MARILFTAVKNEAPFLLEWIAYHKVVGFDRLVVYSNDSTDGTTELLAALAGAGEIAHTVHSPPPDLAPQANAARLANGAGLLAKGDHVIWLDADEFLNIHAGQGELDDLIAALGPAWGMLIPWRIFGDGGNAAFPGRFLSGAFTGAASRRFRMGRSFKTFYRYGEVFRGLPEDGVHPPWIAPNAGLKATDFLNAAGGTLSQDGLYDGWLAGRLDPKRDHLIAEQDFVWNLAQINHYAVRTPEFYELKTSRGRGFVSRLLSARKQRHGARFQLKFNRNEAVDRSILRHEQTTAAEMARLLALPGVASAEKLVRGRVKAALAASALPAAEAAKSGGDGFSVTLPPAERDMVEHGYSGAEVILEYGSGGSTFLALEKGCKKVFTVESDAAWARRIDAALAERFSRDRFVVHHADIGATGAWGKPASAEGRDRYPDYALSIWANEGFVHPDLVLIDGRFRTACLLATALNIRRPTVVLFDDYARRPMFHGVESIARPVAFAGRMARFVVEPQSFPPIDIGAFVRAFYDPR